MKRVIPTIAVAGLIILSLVAKSALALVAALFLVFIWAYRSDINAWKTKPMHELVAMVEGEDWRYWQTALQELHRRGENITRFIPRLVSRLVSDSLMIRTAAAGTLRDMFPEFKEALADYLPTHDLATSRERLKPLLAKYKG